MPPIAFTDEEIRRLRLSFFELIPVSDELSQSFYDRLFDEHPEVRSYFKPDMQSQQDKLVDTLAALLDSLEKSEEAENMLRNLGRRHVGYGATPELYAWVEVAILEIVAQYAKPHERADLHDLWSRLMTSVSKTMMEGSHS